jgi:hypothetical protein
MLLGKCAVYLVRRNTAVGWGLERADELALTEKSDPTRNLTRSVDIVGDHQNGRAAFGQSGDQPVELVNGDGVEAGGRLIEKEDRRFAKNG